jgi:hypothetical protein
MVTMMMLAERASDLIAADLAAQTTKPAVRRPGAARARGG